MGADLIIAYARWPSRDGQQLSPEAAREVYKEAIRGMDRSKQRDIYSDTYGWMPDDDESNVSDDDLDAWFQECLDVAFGPDRRDMGVYLFGDTQHGSWWILTGGMTWGDDPTDAYEAISVLSELDIPEDT